MVMHPKKVWWFKTGRIDDTIIATSTDTGLLKSGCSILFHWGFDIYRWIFVGYGLPTSSL